MQMERVLSDELFDYFRIDSQIDAELLIKLGELLAESFAINPIEMTFNISAEDLLPLSGVWSTCLCNMFGWVIFICFKLFKILWYVLL